MLTFTVKELLQLIALIYLKSINGLVFWKLGPMDPSDARRKFLCNYEH